MSSPAKKTKMSALEQLKERTVVVADTGDFESKNVRYFCFKKFVSRFFFFFEIYLSLFRNVVLIFFSYKGIPANRCHDESIFIIASGWYAAIRSSNRWRRCLCKKKCFVSIDLFICWFYRSNFSSFPEAMMNVWLWPWIDCSSFSARKYWKLYPVAFPLKWTPG